VSRCARWLICLGQHAYFICPMRQYCFPINMGRWQAQRAYLGRLPSPVAQPQYGEAHNRLLCLYRKHYSGLGLHIWPASWEGRAAPGKLPRGVGNSVGSARGAGNAPQRALRQQFPGANETTSRILTTIDRRDSVSMSNTPGWCGGNGTISYHVLNSENSKIYVLHLSLLLDNAD
jgi:hypothetical protein